MPVPAMSQARRLAIISSLCGCIELCARDAPSIFLHACAWPVTDRRLISSVNRPTSSSDLIRQLPDSALTFGRICFPGIRFFFFFDECVPALMCGPSLDRRGHLRQVFPICQHSLLVGQRLLQVSLVVRNSVGVVWCVLRALEADLSFPLSASPREQVADSLSHSRGRSLQRSLPLNHVLPRTTRCTRKPTRWCPSTLWTPASSRRANKPRHRRG